MIDKKPQAGEFWGWAGCRLRIIGTRSNGVIVAEHECGSLEFGCTFGEMKHLPDCDSFDWQPETFPQWYAKSCGGPYADCDHIIRTSKTTLCGVLADGIKTKEVPWEKYHEEFVIEGSWVPLTQAEAEARLKKPEPVGSPDDWVEFDGRLISFPRYEIDELKHEIDSAFEPAIRAWYGKSQQWQIVGLRYKIRCRRRDLPPMPQETPKRDYVRVWMRWTDDKLYATTTGSDDPKDRELKHDGTGFYLEDGK